MLHLRLLVVRFALMLALPMHEAAGQLPGLDTARTAAQTMYAAREPATSVARVLRATHRLQLQATTTILREVGFGADVITGAVRTEFSTTASTLYASLRSAGFSATETTRAFTQHGIPLDCWDFQGNPVPCGGFGGTPDTPTMGQVEWTPKSQGFTDSLLTITGSSIPPVDVRIGSTTLAPVSATASKVVVRLPAVPTQGPLTLRRRSEPVEGKLEGGYQVVAAPPVIPWASLGAVAFTAAIEDTRHWLQGARIGNARCVVSGPIATGMPGVLSSTTGFMGLIATNLQSAGAPPAVAAAWNTAVQQLWSLWANAVTIPALPWYPAFAAWPGKAASPTPNAPTPLAALSSQNAGLLLPQPMAAFIEGAIGTPASALEAKGAIAGFATLYSARFASFLTTSVVGVMGSGPVPAYNPPLSPAGPVVNGTCASGEIFSSVVF